MKLRMQGPEVSDLQIALQLLLDRSIILRDYASARRELSVALKREHAEQTFGETTLKLVGIFQKQRGLEVSGVVDEPTADALNRLLDELNGPEEERLPYVVNGTVRFFDGFPATGIMVSAFDRDLRREQALGRTRTDEKGSYEIQYSERQFGRAEKRDADLVVRAFAADGTLLVASPVLFNAPLVATVDLAIPAEALLPPTLFEKIGRALAPLLEGLKVEDLEEDKEHQDLSFLSGETGFDKTALARFVLAHRLALEGIQAEFWFVLLGGSVYQFTENRSLKEQLVAVLDALPSLDAVAVRKAFVRGFNQKEISEAFREHVAGWIKAFLKFVANRRSETTPSLLLSSWRSKMPTLPT
ncbi:MAG: peptidoglycan-binding domain-containing protein [Gammaproteobacteria bacterium]